MTKDSIFFKLLKKYTPIDKNFINIFFTKYKIGGDLDFDLEDSNVVLFLNIKLSTLRKRLLNFYTKKTVRYIEKVDFIRIKSDKIKYMINYQCFEKLAMYGDSDNSEIIRIYFIKLREFITENQYLIYQSLENKDDLKLYSKYETTKLKSKDFSFVIKSKNKY